MASVIVSSLAVAIAVVLSACTCSNDLVTPREADPTTRSRIRIVVATPNVGGLIVEQNDRQLGAELHPEDEVVPYRELPSGVRNIRLKMATGGRVLFSANLGLNANQGHTLVLLDRSERMRGVLLDDVAPTPEAGTASVRIVNGTMLGNCDLLVNGIAQEQMTDIEPGQATPYSAIRAGTVVNLFLKNSSQPLSFRLPDAVSQEFAAVTLVVREVGTEPSVLVLTN